jgi:membrane protein DedA with SNARE-associated domain
VEYSELTDRVTAFLFNMANQHAMWVYVVIYLSCVLENLFPPFPGDAVIFVGAFLAGTGSIYLPLVFVITVLGSLSGALILYSLGKRGVRKLFIFHTGIFFNDEQLKKIESWFSRYGEKVLLLSRFIAGVRSGIALAAGVGKVDLRKMVIYTFISVLLWNGILATVATILKENYEQAYRFLTTYNSIVLFILAVGIIYWLVKLGRKKLKRGRK